MFAYLASAARRHSPRAFGEAKPMNLIRIKVIAFWLLFVSFWLLMYFFWRYRFLWTALFPAAVVMLEVLKPRGSIKPRGPLQMPPTKMPRAIKICLWLLVIEWVLVVIVHGFLYPQSAGLYLLSKLVLVATSAPVLYYKVRLDYVAFRAVQNASAEAGAPPNAGSASAPPASVS